MTNATASGASKSMTFRQEEYYSKLKPYFVVLSGDESLRDAFVRLEEKGGQSWWFLVVDIGERLRYLAARYDDLRERIETEGATVLDKKLRDIGEPLVRVQIVDVGTKYTYAQKLASENRAGLCVVVEVVDRTGQLGSARTSAFNVLGLVSLKADRGTLLIGEQSLLDMVAAIPSARSPEEDDDGRETIPFTPSKIQADPEEIVAAYDDAIGKEKPKEQKSPVSVPSKELPPASHKDVNSDDTQPALPSIDVSVAGDVEGEVNVAGRDIVQHIYGEPEKRKRSEPRRFEAAFPHEVHVGEEYRLWIAVVKADAPSPFTEDERAASDDTAAENAVPVSFTVDKKTGELEPVDVDVVITGQGCEVVGQNSKTLTVWPDGRVTKRWFLIKASRKGTKQIMIEVMQDGRLLNDYTIQTVAYTRREKVADLLNLSLQIATFSLSFSFGAPT